MKITLSLLLGALSVTQVLPTSAQNNFETKNSPNTTVSVYARRQIELIPPFSCVTGGFEAAIRLPGNIAGSWSAPQMWVPTYQRDADATPPDYTYTGMIGIHTHVLPNGQVLSWEGHNDNEHKPGMNMMMHAYTWNPGNQVYQEFGTMSNFFCTGHTFLADGRLLEVGGHYSGGEVDRGQPALGNPDYNPRA